MRRFTDYCVDGRLIASPGEFWVDIIDPDTQEPDAQVRMCLGGSAQRTARGAWRVAHLHRGGGAHRHGAKPGHALVGWRQSGLGRENGRCDIEQCLKYLWLHGIAPAPAPQATSFPS